jgi:hypothetical protein
LGGCCDDHIPFWNIRGIRFEVYDVANHMFADSAIYIPADAPYRFILVNDLQFVAYNEMSLSDLFIQQALAWSCPEPGEDGMKDSIVAIELTSNHPFNGIPAGQSLTDQILIWNTMTVGEFLQFTGSLQPVFGREIDITFTERPVNAIHKFTIRVELESGKVFSDETAEITWE